MNNRKIRLEIYNPRGVLLGCKYGDDAIRFERENKDSRTNGVKNEGEAFGVAVYDEKNRLITAYEVRLRSIAQKLGKVKGLKQNREVKLRIIDSDKKFLGYKIDSFWNWVHDRPNEYKSHPLIDALPNGQLRRNLEWFIRRYPDNFRNAVKRSGGHIDKEGRLYIAAEDAKTGEFLFRYYVRIPENALPQN